MVETIMPDRPQSASPRGRPGTRITFGLPFESPEDATINLGFEWLIDGDANRNASVEVSYRRVGDTAWKQGLPLLRVQGEHIAQPNVWDLVPPNMFAGSILDLEPGTAYEARFTLSDPDGVVGSSVDATKTVTVRTRPEPYAYSYETYGDNHFVNTTTTYEGTYYLTADGTPDKPIVIKAAGDGEVILDGRDNFNLFNVKAADYNYFEGITFRNTGIAIWAGTQFIAGSKGLTVKRCRFEQVGLGVFTNYSGSSDFYIAAIMASYTAVRVYGPGHVVAHNYVADFHDGIDIETYGNPDGSSTVEGPSYPPREYWDRRPVAIDFYNNYLTNFHDNAFEIDGGLRRACSSTTTPS